jgi:hypothetical protein
MLSFHNFDGTLGNTMRANDFWPSNVFLSLTFLHAVLHIGNSLWLL